MNDPTQNSQAPGTSASAEPGAQAASSSGQLPSQPVVRVNGQPFDALPTDLYIPPEALEILLEAFEGPLDLLLWLIRRQKLDILDLPVVDVTRQYMRYIELMQELKLELAAEYLVMAATLAEIKSRMLLPRPPVDDEGEEIDPRAELIRRLQEYEQFKRAAEQIDELPRLERDFYPAAADPHPQALNRQPLQPDVSLEELARALAKVLSQAKISADHQVEREVLSTRERMSLILAQLESGETLEFIQLFTFEEGRAGVVVTFLAMLELAKEGLVEIMQNKPLHPIYLRSRLASAPDEPESASDQPEVSVV